MTNYVTNTVYVIGPYELLTAAQLQKAGGIKASQANQIINKLHPYRRLP